MVGVVARDGGVASQTDHASVIIHIEDENDNKPIIVVHSVTSFDDMTSRSGQGQEISGSGQGQEISGIGHGQEANGSGQGQEISGSGHVRLEVKENESARTVIGHISVRDRDSGRNALVYCRLNSTLFSLEPLQGLATLVTQGNVSPVTYDTTASNMMAHYSRVNNSGKRHRRKSFNDIVDTILLNVSDDTQSVDSALAQSNERRQKNPTDMESLYDSGSQLESLHASDSGSQHSGRMRQDLRPSLQEPKLAPVQHSEDHLRSLYPTHFKHIPTAPLD